MIFPSFHTAFFHSDLIPRPGLSLYYLTPGPLRHHFESPCLPKLSRLFTHLPVFPHILHCLCAPFILSKYSSPCFSNLLHSYLHICALNVAPCNKECLSFTLSSQLPPPPSWSFLLPHPFIFPILYLYTFLNHILYTRHWTRHQECWLVFYVSDWTTKGYGTQVHNIFCFNNILSCSPIKTEFSKKPISLCFPLTLISRNLSCIQQLIHASHILDFMLDSRNLQVNKTCF